MTNTRASHAISAALNVINLLRENYTEEQAAELEKRFINSIRTNDPKEVCARYSTYQRRFRN